MARHILKCPQCSRYTLEELCSICLVKTVNSFPAKYSPEDKYGGYRREVKKKEWKKKGWY